MFDQEGGEHPRKGGWSGEGAEQLKFTLNRGLLAGLELRMTRQRAVDLEGRERRLRSLQASAEQVSFVAVQWQALLGGLGGRMQPGQ